MELIGTLGKKQLLPVAFFCFSKKRYDDEHIYIDVWSTIYMQSPYRCDSSVDGTGGIDLTTSAEKHTIHSFVEKCLTRLKEGDRQLPQVSASFHQEYVKDTNELKLCLKIRRLRDLMRRGLAVHHAGLLPIMKEVVEMLFCQGYIKVTYLRFIVLR